MSNPYRTISTRQTVQTQPIPGARGRRQAKNNAGGYVFTIDKWDQLNRFLIIGTVGGTYYVNERDHTKDNADILFQCAAEDGARFVSVIEDISVNGRAPKVQPTIFALAVAASADDPATRALALDAVQKVCRTATHLFMFVGFVKQFRGTGSRGMRRTLGAWYTNKPVEAVANQAIKYRNREGYTHRDLLRIAHPLTNEPDRKALFEWITKGTVPESTPSLRLVEGFVKAQAAPSADQAAKIVADYSLPWEAIQTDHLNSPAVWEALLANGMPYTALVRQLPRLTRIGIALGSHKHEIVRQLSNGDAISGSRIHPIALLNALVTYRNGRGQRDTTWTPVGPIIDALDDAFYTAFGNVRPANKRTLLALDVSGSMAGNPYAVQSGPMALSPREGSAAMAMITARTEPDYTFMAFSGGFIPLPITARQRLDDVIRTVSGLSFDRTDCAVPMVWALKNRVEVDTFCIYTDSETFAGRLHPVQALDEYRQGMGINAKLVVVGMTSTGFTIADPNDPGMMDVVGFDTATPDLISSFSRGDF